MKKKTINMSLVLTILLLSMFFSIAVISSVQAKKPAYTSGSVYINDGIPGYTWMDWSAQPWLKGSGTEEDPYLIKDLTIDVSGVVFALMIENSNVHFKIMKCTFRNGGIEDERTAAVILAGTQNGVIFKNTFFGSNAGLALIGTQNNLVQKNVFTENQAGIFLQWSMFDTLKQNECKNNFAAGIMLSTAHKTIIEKNICSENGLAGILLINEQDNDPEGEHDPKDNIIYKNKIENNLYGVLFSRADINDVLYNTFSGNDYGMVLDVDCQGNLIYHNNFLDNGVQAYDAQPSGTNFWFHPYMEEGNYWANSPFGYDLYPFMEKNGWEYMTPVEEEIMAVMNNPESNRLAGYRTVDPSQTSYLILGLGQSFSERINGEWSPPYTVRVWFGDTEIFFQGTFWFLEEENPSILEPVTWQYFYLIIPPFALFDEPFNLDINGEEFSFNWQVSFFNGDEQQVWDLTSYFYF